MYYAVRGFAATESGATAIGEFNISPEPPVVLFDLKSSGGQLDFTVYNAIALAVTPESPLEVTLELVTRATPESARNKWSISVDSLDLTLSCTDQEGATSEK